MNLIKYLATGLIALFLLSGCDEGPAENFGEDVDEAVEETGEELDNAGDEIGDSLEN